MRESGRWTSLRRAFILPGMAVVIVIVVGVILLGIIAAAWPRQAPQEWRRTCRRCSTVWYVSTVAAREQAPTSIDMAAAKMYRAGKRASLFTTRAAAAELGVHNLEAKRERVQSRDSCPGCGSQSFDAQLVPAQ